MPSICTLGGLSLREVLYRTARESWQDAVFGQGGRMAFYHFLAIFPCVLLFFTLTARVPHLANQIKTTFEDLSVQVLPTEAATLVANTIDELDARHLSAFQLASACVGALWAALNGSWALIYGLNRAYEVEERRPWWKLAVTVVGLTAMLAVATALVIALVFYGARLGTNLSLRTVTGRIFEWAALSIVLSLYFSALYRYAPNLRRHEWRWSTPGAICALILWVGSASIVRLYFDHVNNYARSYGHMNRVVMLLLWLYVTNGAILIGGEMNSEIEKAAAEQNPKSDDRSGS
jgi:membrane protein